MPQPTYFDIAASVARSTARELNEQTHWIDYDAPSREDERKRPAAPSCP